MAIYGYINLNVDVKQILDLYPNGKWGNLKIEKLFTMEKLEQSKRISAFSKKKADLDISLLSVLKPKDIVITSSLINFSSQTEGIFSMLDKIFEKEARVIAILENFDSELLDQNTYKLLSDTSKRAMQHQRQARLKGIRQAQEEGRFARKVDIEDENFKRLYESWHKTNITKTEFARQLGITRPTLDKLLQEKRTSEYAKALKSVKGGDTP